MLRFTHGIRNLGIVWIVELLSKFLKYIDMRNGPWIKLLGFENAVIL